MVSAFAGNDLTMFGRYILKPDIFTHSNKNIIVNTLRARIAAPGGRDKKKDLQVRG